MLEKTAKNCFKTLKICISKITGVIFVILFANYFKILDN